MNAFITNLYPIPTPGINDQRLTVDNTAGGVQLSAFSDTTKYLWLDVQDADCFVTFDGSAPTTTNGHKLYAGEKYIWNKVAARSAKFIRSGATSAIIHASEFTN